MRTVKAIIQNADDFHFVRHSINRNSSTLTDSYNIKLTDIMRSIEPDQRLYSKKPVF